MYLVVLRELRQFARSLVKMLISSLTPQAIIHFNVHGSGKKLFGDGFALWYTANMGYEGPVFGNQNYFRGMGIFFDTYSNVQQVWSAVLCD